MSLTLEQALRHTIGLEVEDGAEPVPCQGPDRDLWTSEDEAWRRDAAALCLECPVIEECRLLGEAVKATAGVWGGVDFTIKVKPRGIDPDDSRTKKCNTCHKTKNVNEFQRDHRGILGRRPRCKECTHARRREMKERQERNAS